MNASRWPSFWSGDSDVPVGRMLAAGAMVWGVYSVLQLFVNGIVLDETVGFWDRDTLITWTSNIQGWKSHSLFEFSNQMQSIEIYTPIRDVTGAFVGVNHESIFYDPEALSEPVRIVRNLHKINEYSDADQTPYTFIECVQTIFSVNGRNAPLTPGTVIEYEMPDMYGRPWDAIWRKYFEQGMSRPNVDADLFDFE